MTHNHTKARYDAMERYAAADKSDPFTLARCLAHMRNDICGFTPTGEDAFYSAAAYQEERVTADDNHYYATVYRNRVRP